MEVMFRLLQPTTIVRRSYLFPEVAYVRCFHSTGSNNFKDYYEVLEVPKNASPEQIKSAYYAKAKIYHPDTNKYASGAKKFQEITDAYDILSDTVKKRAYDSTLRNLPYHNNYAPQQNTSRSPTDRPPTIHKEPISMNHINYVYKAMNKAEGEEPRFRPFEDHHFKDSAFNRFEFQRYYDSESQTWVYRKRRDHQDYAKQMKAKHQTLSICICIFMASVLLYCVKTRF